MNEQKDITITLPPTLAALLRDIVQEWLASQSRYSGAMEKMARLVLAVLLDQIESQIPKTEEVQVGPTLRKPRAKRAEKTP